MWGNRFGVPSGWVVPGAGRVWLVATGVEVVAELYMLANACVGELRRPSRVFPILIDRVTR
jgi:hypothetical protein